MGVTDRCVCHSGCASVMKIAKVSTVECYRVFATTDSTTTVTGQRPHYVVRDNLAFDSDRSTVRS